MSTKNDLYQAVTDRIIEALENASEHGWRRPWTTVGGGPASQPVSREGRLYRGSNAVLLWCEAALRGYDSHVWATYKQWTDHGCQVRKGEKGVKVLLWKPTKRKVKDDNGDDTTKASLYVTSYTVFNAEQVDGYEKPAPPEPRTIDEIEAAARAFFERTGAKVRHGGGEAWYDPRLDVIALPFPEQFRNEELYLSTRAHETTHWTGHETRCNRALRNRFGSAEYAAEELVAELGAAFLCAELGISNEPRQDHVDYIKNWIALLRDDNSAIITAASLANKAVDHLHEVADGAAGDGDVHDDRLSLDEITTVARQGVAA